MLRNNQPRAQQAMTVFLLTAIASACLCPVDAIGLTCPDWELVDQNQASRFTLVVFFIRFFLLSVNVVLVVCGYVFLIRWLRRAYYNLHLLPGIRPEYPEGWAAGAWFVPFINLVRPFTIMREVWNDTQRAAFGQVAVPATLLGWWWAAHLLQGFVATGAARLNGSNELAGEIISQLLNIVDAVFTWRIIQRVATFEDDLTQRLLLDTLGQPQPQPNLQADQSDYALEEGY